MISDGSRDAVDEVVDGVIPNLTCYYARGVAIQHWLDRIDIDEDEDDRSVGDVVVYFELLQKNEPSRNDTAFITQLKSVSKYVEIASNFLYSPSEEDRRNWTLIKVIF